MPRTTRGRGRSAAPCGPRSPPLRDISVSTAVPKLKIAKRFTSKKVYFFSQEPEIPSSAKQNSFGGAAKLIGC